MDSVSPKVERTCNALASPRAASRARHAIIRRRSALQIGDSIGGELLSSPYLERRSIRSSDKRPSSRAASHSEAEIKIRGSLSPP